MRKSLTPLEKRLAGYAVSAGVALAVAPAADAQIIYTDIEPDLCVSIDSAPIDIDGNGSPEFEIFHGKYVATYYGDLNLNPPGGTLGVMSYIGPAGRPYVSALSLSGSVSIGPGQSFGSASHPYSNLFGQRLGPGGAWDGGNDAFVGLVFTHDINGTIHYGWLRLTSFGKNILCAAEWAYESTPNAPITAGAVPAETAVTCLPVGPPIIIPAAGGSYAFDIEIVNNGATAEDVDIWFDIDGPGVDRTRGPVTRTLAAGASFQRTLNQNIPAGAPAGDYTHTCNVGTFPIADSSSSFDFEKSVALAPGEVRVTDWSTESEIAAALGIDANAVADIPGTHVLKAAYPNPFNPQSQFTLAVAREQHVTAELYNVLGQQVATLFVGAVEANASQIIQIDGSDLASGVYVVRVAGETFSDALRVTLMK